MENPQLKKPLHDKKESVISKTIMENQDLYDPTDLDMSDVDDCSLVGDSNLQNVNLVGVSYFCARLLAKKTCQIISDRIVQALRGELRDYSEVTVPNLNLAPADSLVPKATQAASRGKVTKSKRKKKKNNKKKVTAAKKKKAGVNNKRSPLPGSSSSDGATVLPPDAITIGTQTEQEPQPSVSSILPVNMPQFEVGQGLSMPIFDEDTNVF